MAEPTVSLAAVFVRGPRFFRDEKTGKVMFELAIDSRNKIGPRIATPDEKKAHRDAYERIGELPDNPLSPRVVVAAEFEPSAEDLKRPYAERRAAAERACATHLDPDEGKRLLAELDAEAARMAADAEANGETRV